MQYNLGENENQRKPTLMEKINWKDDDFLGENAHYDESCSSTLASTFSNGAKVGNLPPISHASMWVLPRYKILYSPQNYRWQNRKVWILHRLFLKVGLPQ